MPGDDGMLGSAIYEGWVRHRREQPAKNAFKYKVFMMYLDLRELDKIFERSIFWGTSKLHPARFKREDFHRPEIDNLYEAVADTVFKQTGRKPNGPIKMLANLRYWGYNVNPLTTFYCFDQTGNSLEYIVAEVTNTPWRERHAYVINCTSNSAVHKFSKQLHVSPFNALSMRYEWRSNTPGKALKIHIENWQGCERVMDASLILQRKAVNGKTLNAVLVRYPFMTVKVISAIYWQALKLWLKKVPYVGHPHNSPSSASLVSQNQKSYLENIE